jgi:glycosyltransferase involved in cell wall biosynthesis
MRIAFALPERTPVPIGGFVVIYEYAALLSARGHQVAVYHPRTGAPPRGAADAFKARLWVSRYRRRPAALAPWVTLPDEVDPVPTRYLGDGGFGDAEVVIATTWDTVEAVHEAAVRAGQQAFYYVQGYEGFIGDEAIRANWRLPVRKIVISRWLEEIAAEIGEGERTTRVPIGLDLERWRVEAPPAERPRRIGAVLSTRKGREDVLTALELAKGRVPDLRASCFGTEPPPDGLPDWIDYERSPDPVALRRLYNSCAVFLQASREEGWGLPATEAMACGAALATYDTGGSREFADDRETALVTAAQDPVALGEAAVELLENDGLRGRLVEAGLERVREFSWSNSVERFERALATAEPGSPEPRRVPHRPASGPADSRAAECGRGS